MARQGDALENPVTGERIVFGRTTADSGGAVLSFAYFLPAGGSVPLAHVHPRQEERFEVVSGRARIRVGQRALVAPLAAIGVRLGDRAVDPRYAEVGPAADREGGTGRRADQS